MPRWLGRAMKTRSTIVLALVASVLCCSGSSAYTQQAPASPAPAAPAKPPRVVLDLNVAPSREPVTLKAPLGVFFELALANRAPSATYHIESDLLSTAPADPRLPRSRQRQDRDLPSMSANWGTPLHVSPDCDALQTASKAVDGARDEREAQQRLKEFLDRSASAPCAKLPVAEATRNVAEPLITQFKLDPDDEIRLTVTRLAPGTRAVERTWTAVIRPESARLDWTYPNEESWIVGETARDIAEMLMYASRGALVDEKQLAFSATSQPLPGSPAPRYTIALSPRPNAPLKASLSFPDHIWAPSGYEPLATALGQALALPPAPVTAPASTLLEALKNPLSSVLARESRRISERLAVSMLDAQAHEEAALVLGVLALREASGEFTDTRQMLCRVAAHLTVAQSLRRGAAAPLRGFADALLLTLVNRQRDALARIEALEKGGPSAAGASFLRALRVRITHDWRILQNPTRASLLERLQHYRALDQSAGTSAASAFLATNAAEPVGDWARITFENGASVGRGQLVLDTMLARELDDVAETWRAFHGTPFNSRELALALNRRPERLLSTGPSARVVPRVIGWGVWAGFFQRNLCFEAWATVDFLSTMLGLPDEARARRTSLAERLSALDLWLHLYGRWDFDLKDDSRQAAAVAKLKADCARGVALSQQAPERLTVDVWKALDGRCRHESGASLAVPDKWFNSLVPAGTALLLGRSKANPPGAVDYRKLFATLHERAPFDSLVLRALAPLKEGETLAEVAALYGPLAEYDLAAMYRIAGTQIEDPTAFRKTFDKIVAVSPESYLNLGQYLEDREIEDDAAAAYEKAIESASDRITLSNSLQWLVGYYCDNNRDARAAAVANLAAEVYSAEGLSTMGYYMERLGRYPEAEAWYQKIVERYADHRAQDAFYVRYEKRVGDGRFGAKAAQALTRLFPSGLQKVSIGDFAAPPGFNEHVPVTGQFARSRRFGLLKGDMVVAVNGYRVRDLAQYLCVWSFDDKPEGIAIVFRNGRYVEIRGALKRVRYTAATRRG